MGHDTAKTPSENLGNLYGDRVKADDYKVVSIGKHGITVYSLKTGSWRVIAPHAPALAHEHDEYDDYVCDSCTSFPVFLKGAIHWIVKMTRPFVNTVISFDVHNETFSLINLPNSGDPVGGQEILAILGDESLALFDVCWARQKCIVWVMEDYGVVESWKVVCKVVRLAQGDLMHLTRKGKLVDLKAAGVKSYDVLYETRKRLLELLPKKSVAIIASAPVKMMTDVVPYTFRQDADYLYITGCLLASYKDHLALYHNVKTSTPVYKDLEAFQKAYYDGKVKDLSVYTHDLRWTMLHLKVYPHERMLAAKVEYECKIRGAQKMAFNPVVGGGANASVIHYSRNDQKVELYNLILETSKECLKLCRPEEKALSDLRRVQNGAVSGHPVLKGCECYDVGFIHIDYVTITIEPGIYIPTVFNCPERKS
ncbi:Intermediate cleaving peptidase 55, mitochondrial-like protein [Drosera capensis]